MSVSNAYNIVISAWPHRYICRVNKFFSEIIKNVFLLDSGVIPCILSNTHR